VDVSSSHFSQLNMLEVVYCDLDGCVHDVHVTRHPKRGVYIDQRVAPGRSLFEWAPYLIDALAPYPQVSIVLSTSWVRVLGYRRTLDKLPEAMRERVIGATYHSSFTDNVQERGPHDRWELLRGQEVLADVDRRKPDAWVALDDTDEGWSDSARSQLVLCEPSRGLGDPVTRERLASTLRRNFGANRQVT
jgi:hypothetical protein